MIQILASVFSLLLGAAILVVGNSLLGIALPVRLGIEHVPEFQSGLVMSAYYLGFVLGSARIQWVIRRAGHIRAFAAVAAILTAAAMVHALIFDIWVWAGLRVVAGFCMAGLYAIIESWLNVKSSNDNRGQVLSIYVVTIYAASFGGQFLVNIGTVQGTELYCVVGLAVMKDHRHCAFENAEGQRAEENDRDQQHRAHHVAVVEKVRQLRDDGLRLAGQQPFEVPADGAQQFGLFDDMRHRDHAHDQQRHDGEQRVVRHRAREQQALVRAKSLERIPHESEGMAQQRSGVVQSVGRRHPWKSGHSSGAGSMPPGRGRSAACV